jgi:hypothetical protein
MSWLLSFHRLTFRVAASFDASRAEDQQRVLGNGVSRSEGPIIGQENLRQVPRHQAAGRRARHLRKHQA